MPVWGQLYFQNSVSPVMEQLIFFHDYTMMIMLMVMVLVGYLLVSSILMNFYSLMIHEGQELESIWTVIPALVLLFIAFPSLRLLYLMEEVDLSMLSIKVSGHQWYWSYEVSEMLGLEMDSYMKNDSEIRLMEVEDAMSVPYEVSMRVIVSADDVIHSWTVPVLGIKVDAVPGRLNQLFIFLKRPGMFMGQCSEICGANHSFMPIVMKSLSLKDFMVLQN